jgi:hypothetical protein
MGAAILSLWPWWRWLCRDGGGQPASPALLVQPDFLLLFWLLANNYRLEQLFGFIGEDTADAAL